MTRLRRILDALTHTGPGYDPWVRAHGEDLTDLKARAEQAEELLRIAHDTSNRAETERAAAVQRAAQVEAAIARVRDMPRLCGDCRINLRAFVDEEQAVLDGEQPAEPEPECRRPQGCDKVISCNPGCAPASRALTDTMAKVGVQLPAKPCPGYETQPSVCTCGCEGCKHNCAAHDPAPCAGCTGCGGPDCLQLTAQEAREVAADLSIQLYRAQDATAFVRECCDIADRQGQQVTTADVRAWLDGPKCARQAGLVLDPADLTTKE